MPRKVTPKAMQSLLLEMMHKQLDIDAVSDIAEAVKYFLQARRDFDWAKKDETVNSYPSRKSIIAYHQKNFDTAQHALEELLVQHKIQNFGITDL